MSVSQNKNGKHHIASQADMTVMMLPSDTNPEGNVLVALLKHVDLIAGLAAKRHSGRANVVTASIDGMNFLRYLYETL